MRDRREWMLLVGRLHTKGITAIPVNMMKTLGEYSDYYTYTLARVFFWYVVLSFSFKRNFILSGAARLARRDKPSTTDERDSQQLQCCLPVKIIIQPDIRPHCSSDLSRNDKSPRAKIHDYSRKNIPRCGKKREDDDGGPLLPWKSEYQESIDKLGHNIIKAKLHHTKTKVIPVYITSN